MDSVDPTLPHESTPGDVLGTSKSKDSVGCVWTIQESPAQLVREDEKRTLYGNTIHTIHKQDKVSTFRPLVEKDEAIVYSENIPTLTPKDHTPSQTIGVSLETFWAIGKQRGYPEIQDLGLRSGMMGWNSFSMSHRLMIPDVIARLNK